MRMQFQRLDEQIEFVKNGFEDRFGESKGPLNFVVAPYRICPLGAHVDHQGGNVLGRTINAYTILGFLPTETASIELVSLNFEGDVKVDLHYPRENGDDWGQYAKGAVEVLRKSFELRTGFRGVVLGTLPGSGLSSSASVGLAYLHALCECNGITLSKEEFIEMDRRLENDWMGLSNGILDQSIIMLSRKNALVYLDTKTLNFKYILDPDINENAGFIIVYSGYSRSLVSTGFNNRVAECREAAGQIGKMSGGSNFEVLGDIPIEIFQKYRSRLTGNLGKRAAHYFGEVERVRKGERHWKEGDLKAFGKLMNESCSSSIYKYESGSQALIDLSQIVSGTEGVFGARFSGGGYGGCVIGLVDKNKIGSIYEEVKTRYLGVYPDVADEFGFYATKFEGGVNLI